MGLKHAEVLNREVSSTSENNFYKASINLNYELSINYVSKTCLEIRYL